MVFITLHKYLLKNKHLNSYKLNHTKTIVFINPYKLNIMKAIPLKNSTKEPYLRVIKNNPKQKNSPISRIYINTLIPGFSYLNNLGENITPKKCAFI